ncbi:putative 4-aminobutyrate aminotransferase [Acaromyces ingoldii]|uniref:Putative 4-aminobutyrate aminotransferase n=1 Tax=Acaromyces ingoldii TaxID=215250 RepID=A0A316YZJ8_9BASI|nr:putative 4-aminobutyrate aminotransferase [Acaromyces ingoldii]PWN93245.1 putative 4-aminobutyrate aminotransferase [Acaromyces ingoldii]
MNGSATMSTADFGTKHVARGIGRLTPFVLARGEGSYVYDEEDNKMLDLTTGIGVVNLGHCHPAVTKAAQEQVGKMVHAQVNIGFNKAYVDFVRALLPKLPDPSLDTVFLWNSGGEAVEASIKLARMATKKQNVIVMQGSYHGRTFGTMSLTRSKTVYMEGFGPLMSGVYTTAFPYYSQLGLPADTPEETLVASSLHQLNLVLAQQSAPKDTAAILIETVVGEGGYVPAPPAFLHGLRSICDKHGILLICDEVQSGCGRTGKMWAVEHSGVRPDVLIFAKGIANGFPLSGIASRKELMDLQPPGSMGGTYSGNAVACAAASAVLKTFDEERILDNVAKRHEQLVGFLKSIQKSGTKAGNLIQDIRGQGLMIGLQFVHPKTKAAITVNAGSQNATVAEDPWLYGPGAEQIAPKVVQGCIKRGMLLLSTSCFDVIRFIPALNITEKELDEACRIFKEALEEVAQTIGA